MVALYDSPHQFEPLLPSEAAQQSLLAQAHDLARAALQLTGTPVPAELRRLLRGMNSYYSNRIEGQHTRPFEIEQALRRDFSSNRELAARQRLAVAHIEAESAIEAQYIGNDGAARLYGAAAVADLHRDLFSRLPTDDLASSDGEPIEPGVFRSREVSVGQHVAPAFAVVPALLERWAEVYGGTRRGEAALLAMAAAHHRLGWIHPFVDGNGRVMRLHSHALLAALGYTGGLWSPLRGFARSSERYYALLAAADEPRRGDLDGRGNLSQQALVDWIAYVLATCQDQVSFMAGLLRLGDMERRIAACLAYEEQTLRSGVRLAALRPLHYLFVTDGALDRGEFKLMTGLGERIAGTLLKALLGRGLLASDTPQGKVRFGLPLHALRFYFPALWPEAEADDGDAAGRS
ncbi:MAG: Fic family protein [Burkholderiales bacterium]|nr:Fic family protein [Burkholderiales bacterium]